jgi:hypothetical protein
MSLRHWNVTNGFGYSAEMPISAPIVEPAGVAASLAGTA